jgi:hypothetical protein
MQFREMLRPSPAEQGTGRALTADAVRTLFDCAQACTACAGSCLSEERITSLRKAIRISLDCADLCEVTARMLSQRDAYDTDLIRAQLRACVELCLRSAEECDRRGRGPDCVEACHRCAESCWALLVEVGSAAV